MSKGEYLPHPRYALAVAMLVMISCGKTGSGPQFTTKEAVERAHGVTLPASTRNAQQVRWGGMLDRGILTLCEMHEKDLSQFTGNLRIRSRANPQLPTGDPRHNGWNVWPTNSQTFVPGNFANDLLQRTWSGEPVPVEMLSCDSSKGDWLHVEVWSSGTNAIIKLYTDWN